MPPLLTALQRELPNGPAILSNSKGRILSEAMVQDGFAIALPPSEADQAFMSGQLSTLMNNSGMVNPVNLRIFKF